MPQREPVVVADVPTLTNGGSVALKIDDSGGRARPVVMEAVLRTLGVDVPPSDQPDDERVGQFAPLG